MVPQEHHTLNPEPSCSFCLIKRLPNQEFFKHVTNSSPEMRQSMQSILAYDFNLVDFTICQPCWKLTQLVQDFRLRCFTANDLVGNIQRGLSNQGDGWFSARNLATIENVRIMVRDQAHQIDRVDTTGEDPKMEDVSNDVLVNEQVDLKSELTIEEVKLESAQEVSGNASAEYKCRKHCDRVYSLESRAMHEITCTADPLTCWLCKAKLANVRKLYDHYRCTHPRQRMYSCETCGERFATRYLLKIHVWSEHAAEAIPKKAFVDYGHSCWLCKAQVTNKSQLKEHYRLAHPGELMHPCRVCGKRFNSNIIRIKHEKKICSGTRVVFPCDKCDKKYTTARKAERHMFRHDETRIYCELCDRSYKKIQYSRHRREMHPETVESKNMTETAVES